MSVTRTFTVTVVSTGSGNKYFIDGVQQATVNLAEGYTYKFDQSDSSNGTHPLRLSTTSDGTWGGGSQYTTGVTTKEHQESWSLHTNHCSHFCSNFLIIAVFTLEWVDKRTLQLQILGVC